MSTLLRTKIIVNGSLEHFASVEHPQIHINNCKESNGGKGGRWVVEGGG
jgi:hypothetical protein